MRVLFVGLGSIGKRTLESCLRTRPENDYAALRRQGSLPLANPRVREFSEMTEVDAFQPELVFVCNPTSLHAETVSRLKKFHAAFFIEKPLADTVSGVNSICAGSTPCVALLSASAEPAMAVATNVAPLAATVQPAETTPAHCPG